MFARIAVIAAKTADKSAQTNQFDAVAMFGATWIIQFGGDSRTVEHDVCFDLRRACYGADSAVSSPNVLVRSLRTRPSQSAAIAQVDVTVRLRRPPSPTAS